MTADQIRARREAERNTVDQGRAIVRANKKAYRIDARPRTPQPEAFSALNEIKRGSPLAQAGREWETSRAPARAAQARSENVAKSKANGTFRTVQGNYNASNATRGYKMDDNGEISGPNDGKPVPTSKPTSRGYTNGTVYSQPEPSGLGPGRQAPRPSAPPPLIRDPNYKEPKRQPLKIEGKSGRQWFKEAANRQGVANQYAEPDKPKAAAKPTAPPSTPETQSGKKEPNYSGVTSPDAYETSTEKARAAAANLRKVNSEWDKSKAPAPQTIQGIQNKPAFAIKPPADTPSTTAAKPTETPPAAKAPEKTAIFNDSQLGKMANEATDEIKGYMASPTGQAIKRANDAVVSTAHKVAGKITGAVSDFAKDQWEEAKQAPGVKAIKENVASHAKTPREMFPSKAPAPQVAPKPESQPTPAPTPRTPAAPMPSPKSAVASIPADPSLGNTGKVPSPPEKVKVDPNLRLKSPGEAVGRATPIVNQPLRPSPKSAVASIPADDSLGNTAKKYSPPERVKVDPSLRLKSPGEAEGRATPIAVQPMKPSPKSAVATIPADPSLGNVFPKKGPPTATSAATPTPDEPKKKIAGK